MAGIFQSAFGRAIRASLRSRPSPTPCTFFTSLRNLHSLSIPPAHSSSFLLNTSRTLPFTTLSTYPSRPGIVHSLVQKPWYPIPHSSRPRMFSSFSRIQSPRHTPHPKRQSQYAQSLDSIPTDVLFWGIIGLNATVFTMWYLAGLQLVSFCKIYEGLFDTDHSSIRLLSD
jgi:hypothetical protein